MFSTSTSRVPARAAPSLVCGDVAITGTLQSDGDVRCARLVVGESGVIAGAVRAATAAVRGRVAGDIRAQTLAIAATARVEGDILYRDLDVEMGAFVQGRLRHCADPLDAIPAADGAARAEPLRAAE